MTYKELPVGSTFSFGSNGICTEKWIKIDDEGRAIKDSFIYASMDAPRPRTGNNRAVKTHGYHFFPKSYLFQYLNSDEEQISFKDSYENSCYNRTGAGFLTKYFSEYDLNVMLPMTKTYKVPDGYTKLWGKTCEVTSLVTIPSVEEIFGRSADGEPCGSERNEIFRKTRITTLTDATLNSMCVKSNYYGQEKVSPSRETRVYPIIKIMENARVEQYDGEYRVLPEIPHLEKDILTLME